MDLTILFVGIHFMFSVVRETPGHFDNYTQPVIDFVNDYLYPIFAQGLALTIGFANHIIGKNLIAAPQFSSQPSLTSLTPPPTSADQAIWDQSRQFSSSILDFSSYISDSSTANTPFVTQNAGSNVTDSTSALEGVRSSPATTTPSTRYVEWAIIIALLTVYITLHFLLLRSASCARSQVAEVRRLLEEDTEARLRAAEQRFVEKSVGTEAAGLKDQHRAIEVSSKAALDKVTREASEVLIGATDSVKCLRQEQSACGPQMTALSGDLEGFKREMKQTQRNGTVQIIREANRLFRLALSESKEITKEQTKVLVEDYLAKSETLFEERLKPGEFWNLRSRVDDLEKAPQTEKLTKKVASLEKKLEEKSKGQEGAAEAAAGTKALLVGLTGQVDQMVADLKALQEKQSEMMSPLSQTKLQRASKTVAPLESQLNTVIARGECSTASADVEEQLLAKITEQDNEIAAMQTKIQQLECSAKTTQQGVVSGVSPEVLASIISRIGELEAFKAGVASPGPTQTPPATLPSEPVSSSNDETIAAVRAALEPQLDVMRQSISECETRATNLATTFVQTSERLNGVQGQVEEQFADLAREMAASMMAPDAIVTKISDRQNVLEEALEAQQQQLKSDQKLPQDLEKVRAAVETIHALVQPHAAALGQQDGNGNRLRLATKQEVEQLQKLFTSVTKKLRESLVTVEETVDHLETVIGDVGDEKTIVETITAFGKEVNDVAETVQDLTDEFEDLGDEVERLRRFVDPNGEEEESGTDDDDSDHDEIDTSANSTSQPSPGLAKKFTLVEKGQTDS